MPAASPTTRVLGRAGRVPAAVTEWAASVGVALLALLLRVWSLGRPHSFEFDETYYAKNAWSMLHFGYARAYQQHADARLLAGHTLGQWTRQPEMTVHPEVGKWMIAAGEWLFGMNPFGWRIAAAVTGSLMVLVMIRLARRVTGSLLLGLVAGLLMTFDGLHLVLSRLALVDIFVAFWTLCAITCTVADRDWMRRPERRLLAPTGRGRVALWRPWLLSAGVCWGLALATKWSPAYLFVAMGLLFWAWSAGARRRAGVRRPVLDAALREAPAVLVHLLLVPLVVYLATWTGWLVHAHAYDVSLSDTQYGPAWGDYTRQQAHGVQRVEDAFRSLWHYHHDVYSFHTGFLNRATHPYQSKPTGWLVLNRPVGVAAQLNIKPGQQGCYAPAGSTCLRVVTLLGNPVVWWFGTLAAVWALVAWILRRDWRYGLVVVGIAASWLPWFRYDSRPIFSYYMIVAEPFLVLGATLLLGQILGRTPAGPRRALGAVLAGAVVLAAAVAFAFFWPVWTDGLLSNADWLHRMWFRRWI